MQVAYFWTAEQHESLHAGSLKHFLSFLVWSKLHLCVWGGGVHFPATSSLQCLHICISACINMCTLHNGTAFAPAGDFRLRWRRIAHPLTPTPPPHPLNILALQQETLIRLQNVSRRSLQIQQQPGPPLNTQTGHTDSQQIKTLLPSWLVLSGGPLRPARLKLLHWRVLGALARRLSVGGGGWGESQSYSRCSYLPGVSVWRELGILVHRRPWGVRPALHAEPVHLHHFTRLKTSLPL